MCRNVIKCISLLVKVVFIVLHFQLRREGARLFMLWFQVLQDNSDEFCQLVYACLIPGFPNPVDAIDWSKSRLSKANAEEICFSISDAGSRERLSSSSSMQLSSDRESEGIQTNNFYINFILFLWIISYKHNCSLIIEMHALLLIKNHNEVNCRL